MAMRSAGGASKTLRKLAQDLGCQRMAVFNASGTSPVCLNCRRKKPTYESGMARRRQDAKHVETKATCLTICETRTRRKKVKYLHMTPSSPNASKILRELTPTNIAGDPSFSQQHAHSTAMLVDKLVHFRANYSARPSVPLLR